MKLRWQDLMHRITGFSVPGLGLQWVPPGNERELARTIVVFLENRRVLFVESEAESPHHATSSVIEIRNFLSDLIARCPEDSQVDRSARQMRASCIAFHRGVATDPDILDHGVSSGHWASWVFLQSLGMLRAQIGTQIAILAARYQVNVEEHLVGIMPPDVSKIEAQGPNTM